MSEIAPAAILEGRELPAAPLAAARPRRRWSLMRK
jgi:hypothetical protein